MKTNWLDQKKASAGISVVAAMAMSVGTAQAAITFASDADYNNSAVQTTGVFRDVLNGSQINRGADLGGTGHTALNFTGEDNNAALNGRIAVYDTNVTDGLPTLFSGNISIRADFLISTFNNSKGAGLLFLYNEGAGQQGLALHLWNNGNTDSNKIQLVEQTGETRPLNSLSSVALGTGIAEDVWYEMVLDLSFSGLNFTATGTVFSHTVATDPNSALGAQVGSTLVYNSVLSSSILTPYEIGLVARGDSAVVDTSVTNFSFIDGTTAVPEPGTLALLGVGLVGLTALRRKRAS